MTQRTLVWFSCGAASAIAARLTIGEGQRARHPLETDVWLAYCETKSEHEDNERFLADCETWLGMSVRRLRNPKYRDTWHVWEERRYMAGNDGAPCTTLLKVDPRLLFQRPDDVHVFGYTADKRDMTRAKNLRANYPELTIKTPLIDAGLTKAACIAMVERAGIEVPAMYKLGYENNNCIPCVKATSPNYWALIRKTHPAEFERAAKLARELDVRLARINDVRVFIDEIPADWPTNDPIQPSCDFLCHIAEHAYG